MGLKQIAYDDCEKSDHYYSTQEEVEAALATAPNVAFFGSSYHRTIPYKLWIWNAFHDSQSVLGQWMSKTFGNEPVLMSWVNPELRASVAQSQLRNHGYFRGSVGYDEIVSKNGKESKIAYTVNCGHLFTIDSVKYSNFPYDADTLIDAHSDESKLKKGVAFDVA